MSKFLMILVSIAMQHTIVEAQFTGKIEREATGLITHKFRVPAGTAGSLIGFPFVMHFPNGHDFEIGDVVDFYWEDDFSASKGIVRGDVIIDVDGDLVQHSGVGEGDYPSSDLNSVVVSRQVVVQTVVDPETMVLLAVGAKGRRSGGGLGIVDFRDDGDSSLLARKVTRTDSGVFWTDDFGDNPLLGGVLLDVIVVSNGTTSFLDFFIIIQYDSTLP